MRFKSRQKVQPELVASTDPSRPVLTTVHLNAEQSVVEVTDSYMLARFPVELDEGDTSGPIPIEALKASRKSPLKHAPHTSIALNGDAQVRMCDADGGEPSAPYLTVPRGSGEYTFPDTARLLPDNPSGFEIGLNAELLYKLSKALGAKNGVRISFTAAPANADIPDADPLRPSNMRPMIVRALGATEDDPTGLLMPIRISG